MTASANTRTQPARRPRRLARLRARLVSAIRSRSPKLVAEARTETAGDEDDFDEPAPMIDPYTSPIWTRDNT